MAWRRSRAEGDQTASAQASSSSSTTARQQHHQNAPSTSATIGEYLAPFSTAVSQSLSSAHAAAGNQAESTRLLADLAPHIMKPRLLSAATNASHSVNSAVSSNALVGFLPIPLSLKGQGFSLTQPARNLVRIGNVIRNGPFTSNDLIALESSHQILADAAAYAAVAGANEEGLCAGSSSTHATLALTSSSSFSSSADQVSLLRGFQATLPSSLQGRERRRKERARQGPRLGLKHMGDRARGLLTDGDGADLDDAASADSGPTAALEKRRERRTLRAKAKEIPLSEEDLVRQDGEVKREREDIEVRRRLLHGEVAAVDAKIAALQQVKEGLARQMTALREEELELEDEQAGIGELISLQRHRRGMPGAGNTTVPQKGRISLEAGGSGQGASGGSGAGNAASASGGGVPPSSSRRRKGPLFLPGEHDELPSNVAFMTLAGHTAPITALDFSEPYGTLVSAGADGDASTRVWDLSSGLEVGRLRHDAIVKALQVEDELCITGGADARVKIWDLRKVEDWETRLEMKASGQWGGGGGGGAAAVDEQGGGADGGSGLQQGEVSSKAGDEDGAGAGGDAAANDRDEADPKLRTLEGHSKAVTGLYFDDTCLVTGASDKTLRQWDLNTGQCVLTMDILWAISNPSASQALGVSTPSPSSGGGGGGNSPGDDPYASPYSSSPMASPARRPGLHTGLSSSNLSDWSGNFSFPTPPLADGSWELYTDFVGSSAIQFWGYALASGSADGAVRMWDMRTGQAHRTLLGHTAPVTTLQFDETHVISGSLDRSIRIWDLRTGGIAETIRFDYPVSKLQFDSRKIVAAVGESGIEMFNRTTLQHSHLTINGHTKPAERLRYMDRYAVSGGRDAVLKVWAL